MRAPLDGPHPFRCVPRAAATRDATERNLILLLRRPEHAVLEDLGDGEADLATRRDLDRLAGLRVASHAGLHLAQAQDAEPRDLDGLPLLDGLAGRLDQRDENLIRLLLRDVCRRGEL